MRDYDKEPIVIKDLGRFYNLFAYTCIWFIIISFGIYNTYYENVFGRTVILVTVGFVALVWIYYNNIKYFINGNQNIILSNSCIQYKSFDYNIKKQTINIKYVQYVFISSLTGIDGIDAYQNKTLYQLFFKTDILELFFYLLRNLIVAVLFILFILPYKIIANRSLKTFLIFFDDGGYFNINTNSKKEFNQVIKYFKDLNIEIEDKTKLIQISYEEF